MKKLFIAALFAAMGVFAQGIHWEKDFKHALVRAKQLHKPIFFVYSRHSCKWCRHLESTTFRDPRVIAALNGSFVNVVSYTDENDYTPRKLMLPGTPGLWFLDSSGEPMFQPVQGAVGASDLLRAIRIVEKEFDKRAMRQRYGNKR